MTEFGIASRASSTRQDCSDAFVERELGLGCAVHARHAAYYASWADSLPMVRQRHPDVADSIIMGLVRDPALCFRAVRDCEGQLRAAGFEPPPWEDIAEGHEPQLQKKSW